MTRCTEAFRAWVALGLLLPALAAGQADKRASPVVIGSKAFTESVILGEMMTELLESEGIPATHWRELGGTRVLWNGLQAGDIDAYVEYTGTVLLEILREDPATDDSRLEALLAERGVAIAARLGFNNTYVLGMREADARTLGIRRISDLRAHPELKFGLSNEFVSRADGWPGLRAAYGLPHPEPRGLQHELAYRGLATRDIDVIDLYSTDPEIEYYNLRRLEDDLEYFPRYEAVILYRQGLRSDAVQALRRLEGVLDEDSMASLNAAVKIEGRPAPAVAAAFLTERLGTDVTARTDDRLRRFVDRSLEHLRLVGISLGAAILIAIPLGILAYLWPRLGEIVLAATSIVQTIPALALLVLLIPWFGIGAKPAIVALFLFSLLPIVRNTQTGLRNLPGHVRESAMALGLPTLARLRLVELPLAGHSIVAGIKTAAVINVGTATLGALIGAGGYGEPILTWHPPRRYGSDLRGRGACGHPRAPRPGAFELVERRWITRGDEAPFRDGLVSTRLDRENLEVVFGTGRQELARHRDGKAVPGMARPSPMSLGREGRANLRRFDRRPLFRQLAAKRSVRVLGVVHVDVVARRVVHHLLDHLAIDRRAGLGRAFGIRRLERHRHITRFSGRTDVYVRRVGGIDTADLQLIADLALTRVERERRRAFPVGIARSRGFRRAGHLHGDRLASVLGLLTHRCARQSKVDAVNATSLNGVSMGTPQ
jgi:osmoprotectant transport system permease protein